MELLLCLRYFVFLINFYNRSALFAKVKVVLGCGLGLLLCCFGCCHLLNLWCNDPAGPNLMKSWRITLLLSLYSHLLANWQIVQCIFLFEILLVVVGHPSIRAGLKILNCVSGLDRFNANIVFLQKKIKMFLLGR